jgi:hypothetical protein
LRPSSLLGLGLRWQPKEHPKCLKTDDAFAYRLSRDFQNTPAQLGKRPQQPPHPFAKHKAQKFNRALQGNWACRHLGHQLRRMTMAA